MSSDPDISGSSIHIVVVVEQSLVSTRRQAHIDQ